MNIKTADFGIFVIFAALYAAGTMGLPELNILLYQIKPGEMPTAMVGIFGPPAVIGLVLGQWIASTTSSIGAIDMLSPVVSLAGLLIILCFRRLSVLFGSLVYVLLTSIWMTYLLGATTGESSIALLQSTLLGQSISVMIGYVFYQITRRTIFAKSRITKH